METQVSRLTTDYGVLLELFMNTVTVKDRELQHKSFITKIYNKIHRFHKRRLNMCRYSEDKVKRAITRAEKELKPSHEHVSLGAMCWLIYNRHKEELAPYGFDPVSFEQMNKFFGAQGLALQTAKVLKIIEENMHED